MIAVLDEAQLIRAAFSSLHADIGALTASDVPDSALRALLSDALSRHLLPSCENIAVERAHFARAKRKNESNRRTMQQARNRAQQREEQ